MGLFNNSYTRQQATTIPLADTTPVAEAKTAAAGSMDTASRGDHVHPRLTSSTNHTLDANGFVTVTFTRTFDTEPAISLTALGSGTDPVPDYRADFTKTGALWTGATIYGSRPRSLPTITPLNGGLIGLLGTLISALNPILSSLSGFLPVEPAAGSRVSCVVIKNSST